MPPHYLTNFEIQNYYQIELKLNSVYSRNNLFKIKNVAYVQNLDEFKSIGTNWIALYANAHYIVYFDRFGGEHIPKEIKILIGNKNIIRNIFNVKAFNNSVMRGYFCIRFVGFMLKGKRLLDYTNLFSPNDYEKNDKNNTEILLITKKLKEKLDCVIWGKYRKFEKPKI